MQYTDHTPGRMVKTGDSKPVNRAVVSASHTQEDITFFIKAFRACLA